MRFLSDTALCFSTFSFTCHFYRFQ